MREAFPSIATSTTIMEGSVTTESTLSIVSEMNDGGTLFGDGIEEDRLEFRWGMRARVRVARETLRLVRA